VPSNGKKNKENVYTHNRVLFSHKEEQKHVISRKMDGTGDHHINGNKPE
jgi:hypothetical protein